MLVVREAAPLLLLVSLSGGCSSSYACSGLETGDQPAIFHLSCGPTDLASVVLSGPCSTGDAGIATLSGGASLGVFSSGAGVCHVTLKFATGFTYSADVTFVQQTQNDPPGCPVWHYLAPTQRDFTVDNPGTTCVDAGLDAGADGPAEASQEICPADAGQSVSCGSPATCTGCRYNVRYECTCADAADASAEASGLQWQCIDTGMPCSTGP